MPNSNLVQMIKQVAMDAVRAAKLSDYQIGTVVSTNPLTVKLSNEATLDADFLQLTHSVTNYECTLECGNVLQIYEVKNALQEGEKVLMLRKTGGQRYMIIDRVVG